MASYRELLKQHEELQRQIDAARRHEVAGAIDRVRQLVREYGLTPGQIFALPGVNRRTRPGAGMLRYRDPAPGATWSGMGREPSWIKGQSREQFLILTAASS
ncbi:UNVERIFIED_ORG: DNA-binding protein H-NS [Burkholderia sp. 1595]|uniref:DNA-binding protein H-NS n=1 Tax=Paraburkholderia terricola TaxID=169427 RepID=A0ABU1M2W1_9BURK|nr:H-NS histone family protein [Paraburkholderia terricola]MDR6413156.1 DNA-binding protein H-NS [Paraburkholderia terricola]